MPTVGETAPDFELLNQDGETVRLSDFRGQKVILFAYPKADTPGCTIQACGMRDNFPTFQANNATVIGISPDSPVDLKKWQEKQNLPYTLVSDPNHEVLDAWGVWGEKSMFGKKYMGVTRSHWVIDENGVIIDENIKISPDDSVNKALNLVTVE